MERMPDMSESEEANSTIECLRREIAALKDRLTVMERAEYRHAQLTRQRAAETQRIKNRVEAILNHNPYAILLLREDGAIRTGNPAFKELVGYHVDEVYGQSPDVLLDDAEQAARFQRGLADTIRHGRTEQVSGVSIRRKDGTSFEADIALAPIREEGAVRGVVCNIRDITELREIERMKEAFVSSVSHELRTPVTNLKLYLHLMELNPEKGEPYMATLRREAKRLEHLVEAVLFIANVKELEVAPNYQPTDLAALAGQYVADRTSLAADEHKLTMRFNAEANLPGVKADPAQIERALGLLLDNAFKYTPPGGRIEVSVVQCSRDGNDRWVALAVSDSGPGIPSEEQTQIFTRFFRGQAALNTRTPGAGLGLAIASEILTAHKGRIEVESPGELGKGTTFTLCLPPI
jgi:PAS domain S-box-containing protein